MKLLLHIIGFVAFAPVFSQTRSPLSCFYTSVGCYSIKFSDIFSAASNQATLAQLKSAAVGLYAEKRFLLRELSFYQLVAAIPSSKGSFGLSVRYQGSQTFNESQIGFGYGRKLGDRIDLGVQFNYNNIRIQGYGNASTFTAELGTIWHISSKLHAGIHMFNPVGGKFGKQDAEKLAAIYTTGLGYEVSDKVFISSEIGKEENQPVNITVGLQYNFVEQFFIRTGWVTANNQTFFGAGIRFKKLRADVIASYRPQLGFTPSLLFVFSAKDVKEE